MSDCNNGDKHKRETAADIVFETVYQVSEDMLGLVHKLVSDNTMYERAFQNMAKKLTEINSNLKKFVFSKKWVSRNSKKNVKLKMDQTEQLISIAYEYSKKCRGIADELIGVTQKLESNKKLQNMINELVDRLEKTEKEDQSEDSDEESED